MEWKNKFNSFNSDKGLTYLDSHYRPFWNWLDKKGKLPGPVELSLDPGHLCNLACQHCNAQRYLQSDEVPKDGRVMSYNQLEGLVRLSEEMGIRSACIGGGGEPLMNPDVHLLPGMFEKVGMESSFATNGTLIDEEIAYQMMECRWVGVSVDAASAETYEKLRGIDLFGKTVRGIEKLVRNKKETNSDVDISYKFLISPENQTEIYQAAMLAKGLGVQDFHARPADLQRKDYENMKGKYDFDTINLQFDRAHRLEDDNFRVYTVRHKYDEDFKVKHDFNNCSASTLCLQVCHDGAYICPDHRLEERFKMCELDEIKDYWGSDEHRELVKSVSPDEECARCTYGSYAQQVEQLKGDPMCVNFP